MFTSDTRKNDRNALRTAFVYLLITLFLAVFGAVYEHFSHGVYSFFMAYAFLFPLAGGVLPFFGMGLTGRYPGRISRGFWHCTIATLTAGSIVKGILDIYGTTNALTAWYWIVGAGLSVASIFFYFTKSTQE